MKSLVTMATWSGVFFCDIFPFGIQVLSTIIKKKNHFLHSTDIAPNVMKAKNMPKWWDSSS